MHNILLTREAKTEEVFQTAKQISLMKTVGPDDMHATFIRNTGT